MKDNYDFKKMRRVPHPLANSTERLIDNIGSISDAEFELKLQELKSNERTAVRKQRRLRQADSTMH